MGLRNASGREQLHVHANRPYRRGLCDWVRAAFNRVRGIDLLIAWNCNVICAQNALDDRAFVQRESYELWFDAYDLQNSLTFH